MHAGIIVGPITVHSVNVLKILKNNKRDCFQINKHVSVQSREFQKYPLAARCRGPYINASNALTVSEFNKQSH